MRQEGVGQPSSTFGTCVVGIVGRKIRCKRKHELQELEAGSLRAGKGLPKQSLSLLGSHLRFSSQHCAIGRVDRQSQPEPAFGDSR